MVIKSEESHTQVFFWMGSNLAFRYSKNPQKHLFLLETTHVEVQFKKGFFDNVGLDNTATTEISVDKT